MKISVVIPTYNRGYIISRAVNSVLNQTFLPYEIIVVDDGSIDNTKQVLTAYLPKIKYVLQENQGVSVARNKGISTATGEWIALLDSDDEWLPDKLQNHVRFFDEHKHLKIFQCEETWIRNGIRVNPREKHKKHGGAIFEKCLPLCIVSPSAVIFKKSLWQEMNGFDETFPVCEDYDLWLRVTSLYPVGLDKRPGVIKYGGHKDQLSRSYPVIDEYRVKALEKQIINRKLNRDQKVQVLQEAIKKTKIIISGAEKRLKETVQWKSKLDLFRQKLVEMTNH
jgi:glycosyltransferase involved in cell wall biosynthesis